MVRPLRDVSKKWENFCSQQEGGSAVRDSHQAVGQRVRSTLEAYAGGELPQFDLLERSFTMVRLSSGEPLIRLGEQHRMVYLMLRGLVKVHEKPGPSDRTRAFLWENQIVSSLTALRPLGIQRVVRNGLDARPEDLADAAAGRSSVTITALETCELMRMDYGIIEELCWRYARWSHALTTYHIAQVLHWQADAGRLRSFTAEQHYRWLAEYRPGLVGRVRQKELAGYLGVTEVGLSRIVARVRRGDND
jgi:CRP-like cAMP-binding protein